MKSVIKIRRMELEDAEEYFEIAKEAEVRKYFLDAYASNFETAKKILKDWTEYRQIYMPFAIINAEGKMVGVLIAERTPRSILKKVTVSYFVSEKFRKRGYCKLAIQLFKQYILDNTNYMIIDFIVAHSNIASNGVMQSLNVPFSDNGIYRKYHMTL